MRALTRIGGALFVAAVLAATWISSTRPAVHEAGPVLVADFHVHPFPGDGALTAGQLQREAVRRGLDVIALTGHNNQAGWKLANVFGGTDDHAVIVLPGQEVTAPAFHMAAIGLPRTVSWNRNARDIIEEVHALGGAVIAAHPVEESWHPRDPATLALLDGLEVAHPEREDGADDARQLDEIFAAAQRANSRVSAIGSSDFHMGAPLGRFRTYVFAEERSASGVIRAVRSGRTVAEDARGQLFGPDDLVPRVTPALRARRTSLAPSALERTCALAALAGLALITGAPRQRRP